jgi:DNA replicative helicase MCM subunit Mcm2 (Cdc46/Mcm family)
LPGQDDEGYDTVVNGATGEEPKEEKLRPGVDVSVISKWEAFFQGTEYMQKVREVADLYPEVRSVNVGYDDLDRFDADLAASLLEHPDLYLLAGKQAMKNLMHQDMRRAGINLRILGLPRDSRVEIRELRAKHVGKLVSVEGMVRKATEVRPKITDAMFQCLRCGHVIRETQEGLFFKEPMECYKEQDGCGRSAGSTKFKLLTEESRFVDTQKVEVQESPEGLRGGAQPERLTGYLEDDAAGSVSPGDRITLNGILRSVQKGQPAKSTLFDINLDIIAAESQRHEYEEIQISEEDEKEIIEVAHSPDVFKKIVGSISPTIYGYDVEKESLALQLFGGVPKKLDDGTRIRGDIHILLIGDPGVAKCVVGDTDVGMPDGSTRKIREVVEGILASVQAEKIDDGLTAPADLGVLTFSVRGRMEAGKCVRVWKRTAPEKMLRITTAAGRTVVCTPTHPLFVQNGPRIRPVEACCLNVGRPIAVSTGLFKHWDNENFGFDCGFDLDPIASKEEIDPPEEWVYDLEVDESHNYIANGIVSHNSQMLRYMSRLAPRGIYASGKSSSAAGLCVAPGTLIEVDGNEVPIGDFVESRMRSPVEARPGQWREGVSDQHVVATVSDRRQTPKPVDAIWRIETPSFLVEIVENSGRRLTLTPETMVWCMPESSHDGWTRASDVEEGQQILVRDASTGNFRWSRVQEVRKVTEELPSHVYDLTVSGSHSFVANGFVVHNTAAAVKDDFGEGRWTLEAGALVLADKGHACLEENTPVLTNHGFKLIRDVRPGDQVVNYDSGYHCARVKRVISKGVKRTIKLHTYTGDVIECTPDHQILTGRGWIEAGALVPKDTIKVPADYTAPTLIRKNSLEKGFVHGFALCDIFYNEVSPKNSMGFTAAAKNDDRVRYVLDLLEKHYSINTISESYRPPSRTFIRGREINWSENVCYQFSSATLKKEVSALFHQDLIDLEDRDYCLGLLAGVLSTDCCVSHKQGAYGEKHIIDIGIGRKKYGPEWTERKQRLLMALFQSFGIMAVKRGRKVQIFSSDSYNRAVDLIGPFVVGHNASKLYHVDARTRICSFDTLLDDEYVDWFSSVKFHTGRTVELGLHSRIYRAMRSRKVSVTLMETLRPYWKMITDAQFREPAKNYLLNPVVRITPGAERPVYDLTIDGKPNFLVSGGIVHNCVDEMDKMTDQDRSSMHEAMESQCYDELTEILTNNGWKPFTDVEKDDLVASLSKEGELVFVKPTRYVDAEYDGEMYYIEGRQVSLAVTPNHNMYVSLHKRADEWQPYRLQRMDSIPIDKKIKFRRNASWKGEEKDKFQLPPVVKYGNQKRVPHVSNREFNMDDWLEFLGYFISEGSVQRTNGIPYRVHITQTKDPEKIKKIEACIARLGYKVLYDGRNFALSDKQLATYLAPLGKCHDKYIPREYLELSSRQLLILFKALMLGDGHHRKTTGHREYGTSSKKLADCVQELALKIGISANIKVVLPGKYTSRLNGRKIDYSAPHYVVSLIDGYRRNMNEPMINTTPNRKNISKAHYSGRIYCVEVPDHILYVRRNGKPVWCGNTVSVAKAGITATLQCRCSLLGAANPKYGRFQEHQYIAEQINMPPALLSRFDLIFAMTDKPSADRDTSITQHILKSHRRGQVLKYEDPAAISGIDGEKILADTTTMLPVLERDFLRKYVAYSKRINPILSDEAMALISQFYLKIRKQGEGEGASVPITARQLEAFVRLSEASARARLSTVVEADDAQRAVRIVDYYLRRIAGEGDKLDFDIIATGTSHSQREQIGILKKLVSGLAKNAEFKKGVPAEEIYKSAMAEGITEDRAKTLLKRLAQNGEIYSPSPGHYRLASEG